MPELYSVTVAGAKAASPTSQPGGARRALQLCRRREGAPRPSSCSAPAGTPPPPPPPTRAGTRLDWGGAEPREARAHARLAAPPPARPALCRPQKRARGSAACGASAASNVAGRPPRWQDALGMPQGSKSEPTAPRWASCGSANRQPLEQPLEQHSTSARPRRRPPRSSRWRQCCPRTAAQARDSAHPSPRTQRASPRTEPLVAPGLGTASAHGGLGSRSWRSRSRSGGSTALRTPASAAAAAGTSAVR